MGSASGPGGRCRARMATRNAHVSRHAADTNAGLDAWQLNPKQLGGYPSGVSSGGLYSSVSTAKRYSTMDSDGINNTTTCHVAGSSSPAQHARSAGGRAPGCRRRAKRRRAWTSHSVTSKQGNKSSQQTWRRGQGEKRRHNGAAPQRWSAQLSNTRPADPPLRVAAFASPT